MTFDISFWFDRQFISNDRWNTMRVPTVECALYVTEKVKVQLRPKVVFYIAAMISGRTSTARCGPTKFLKRWTAHCKMFSMRWPEVVAPVAVAAILKAQQSIVASADVPFPFISLALSSQSRK